MGARAADLTGQRFGRLVVSSTIACGCRRGTPGSARRNRTTTPTYNEAHRRVKFIHGPASTHPCVDCGRAAQDWSYDHTDSQELRDPRGRPYSADPAHYQARCRVCHKRLDNPQRERESA